MEGRMLNEAAFAKVFEKYHFVNDVCCAVDYEISSILDFNPTSLLKALKADKI